MCACVCVLIFTRVFNFFLCRRWCQRAACAGGAATQEAVEQVRKAMAGKSAEVHVYPGSSHGFNCWARASYHAPSAALALGRSLSFLAERLF